MKKIPVSLLKLINVLLVAAPYAAVWFLCYEPITRTRRSAQSSVLMLAIYIVVFFYVASQLDGFKISTKRLGDLAFGQVMAVGVTDVIAAVLIWMMSIHFPNLVPGLLCFAVQILVIILTLVAAQWLFFKTHAPKKAVIVYDVRQGMEELISSYGLERRFDVKATYAVEDAIRDLGVLDQAQVVFMCGLHSHERNILLKQCVACGKRVLIIPRVGDMVMSSAKRSHMFHLPFLYITRYCPPTEFLIIKRLFDIMVSGAALLVLSPLMLLVGLLVKLDGGPAFYKQVRLTKNGREFKILKFRSMRVDAERFSGAVLSSGANDPRVTKVGRIIRACRLDELPQLINILIGDMSIVGPRPERPEIAAEYEKTLPEFSLRLQCKAGLTGYAQVYGKYNTEPYDKLLMDLMYIAQPSLLEDLTIMLATVKILFSKESTEGLGEQSAALRYSERPRS